MKYKINWVTKKTGKSGKEYLEMTLRELDVNGVEGTEIPKVTTFTMTYMPGQEIEGSIVENGNFKNFKAVLEPPNFIKANNFKTQQMEKVMERKETSISNFQSNREESIKIASTMSSAVNLAIAEKISDPIALEEAVLRWRYWLWENWDMPTEKVVNNTQPFVEK